MQILSGRVSRTVVGLFLVTLATACRTPIAPQDLVDTLFPDERSTPDRPASRDEWTPWRVAGRFEAGVTTLDYDAVRGEDFDGAYAGFGGDFGVAPFDGPIEIGVRAGLRGFGLEDPDFRGVYTDISGGQVLGGGYVRFTFLPIADDVDFWLEGFGGGHFTDVTVRASTTFRDVTGSTTDGGVWYGGAFGASFRDADVLGGIALVYERLRYDELAADQDALGIRVDLEHRF